MTERRRFLKQAVRAGTGAALAAAGISRPAAAATRTAAAAAQASPNLVRFDHVAAPLLNPDTMLPFYRALGFEVREATGIYSVHFGDSRINFHRPELWQRDDFTLRAAAARPPCGDFCFVWGGTAAELEDLLQSVNADIIEGPLDRQGGQNLGRDTGVSRYTRDPDGNLLEFIIYP